MFKSEKMNFQPQLFDSEGKRKYLTSQERKAFEKATRNCSLNHRLFCLMLYYTGCRVSEATALKKSDIDLTLKGVNIRTLKRSKQIFRFIPLPVHYLQELDNLVNFQTKNKENEPIWNWSRTNAWRVVKNAMAVAQLKGLHATPKGLRHGFGVNCIEKDIPLNYVQKWLGHSSIQITSSYLIVLNQNERIFAERLWE